MNEIFSILFRLILKLFNLYIVLSGSNMVISLFFVTLISTNMCYGRDYVALFLTVFYTTIEYIINTIYNRPIINNYYHIKGLFYRCDKLVAIRKSNKMFYSVKTYDEEIYTDIYVKEISKLFNIDNNKFETKTRIEYYLNRYNKEGRSIDIIFKNAIGHITLWQIQKENDKIILFIENGYYSKSYGNSNSSYLLFN